MKIIRYQDERVGISYAAQRPDGKALTSYRDVAESEEYRWPLSSFVPGVLAQFDLPDCYRALAAKQLRQIAPCGALAANV